MYFRSGSQLYREAFVRALRMIYSPMCRVKIPSQGRTRLSRQPLQKRYVLHAMYASPVRRGFVEMIEDIIPIYDTPVEIDLPETVRTVTLQPEGAPLPFSQEGGCLRFTIPVISSYQAVEIAY